MKNNNNDFIEIDKDYSKKHYPNGYFTSIAKNGGGRILIICGAVPFLIGIGLCYMALQTELIGVWAAALIFLIPGLLIILFGVKRRRMGPLDWIKKCIETSGYPDKTITEFGCQAAAPGSIRLRLTGAGGGPQGIGVLTPDYLLFENLTKPCVMKITDIKGAYLIAPMASGNTSYFLAIFSNRNTFITTRTKLENAETLIHLLLERNPGIDTADGRLLTSDEYKKLEAEYSSK